MKDNMEEYMSRYGKVPRVILSLSKALGENGFTFSDKRTKRAIRAAYVALDLDPDECSVAKCCDVECTSDGLVSLNRMCMHEKTIEDVAEKYRLLRRRPLIWWPQERGGINQSRAASLTRSISTLPQERGVINQSRARKSGFGDRPDATFHDLHRHLLGLSCRMGDVYRKPKTAKWLDSFKLGAVEGISEGEAQWRNVVDWMGIKGWLVDDEYRVYDLEAGDGSVIDVAMGDYPKDWSSYNWSDAYYRNVCGVMEKWLRSLDDLANE